MSLKIDMRGKAERLYIMDENGALHKASFRVRKAKKEEQGDYFVKHRYLYIRWRAYKKIKERYIGRIG